MKLTRIDGYDLLHQGAIVLSEMEANGMRLDVPYLQKTSEELKERIAGLEVKLRGMDEYKLQRRRFGQNTNLHSRDQLGAVLFNDLGHKPLTTTDSGAPQLDEVMLEKIGTEYCKIYIQIQRLGKLKGTYIDAFIREVEGEFLHAFFGLHLVLSYRSQSDSPNLQNIPIRDAVIGPLIRKAFIPRPGRLIVESDYSGAEVRVACSLSGDEKLTYDVLQGDMHRDMAAECFFLDKDKVPKPVRQTTKGGFVFAEFYGDWYKQVCKNLWDDIELYHLATVMEKDGSLGKGGIGLYEHLKSKGITGRGACDPEAGDPVKGTFEAHIKEVENRFWNVRFKTYHAKRKAWVEEYKRKGYVDLATGFRCQGPMTKNQIINYPVQGPSFHCLLWSAIQINKQLKRYKMATLLTGQIHDSLLADVPEKELKDYTDIVRETMIKKVAKAYPWLTVPMDVEIETSATNWYEKAKYEPK